MSDPYPMYRAVDDLINNRAASENVRASAVALKEADAAFHNKIARSKMNSFVAGDGDVSHPLTAHETYEESLLRLMALDDEVVLQWKDYSKCHSSESERALLRALTEATGERQRSSSSGPER